MSKSLYLIFASLILTQSITAQDSKSFYDTSYESRNSGSWTQSTSILSIGLGFPHWVQGGHPYSISGFPALYLKYEKGFLRDEIGLGGYISTGFGAADDYVHNTNSDFVSFSVAVLGYYHFNKLIPIKKMDVYGGAGLAFKGIRYNEIGYDDISTVTVPFKVGIRYYVKSKFSFYAEGGYDGMTGINLGITLKLQ